MTNFAEQVEAEEAAERQHTLAHVKRYDVERDNERTAKAQKDASGVVLRNWLTSHPDEPELVDEEWGLKAFMQFGGRTTHYDKPSAIKERNPQLYQRLEELGVFQIDKDLVEKAIADGQLSRGDLFGYAHEGERSPTLQVKRL